MPNPEAMTDPAGAVEQLRRAIRDEEEEEVLVRAAWVRAALSRITELEKALGPFAEAFDPERDGSGLYPLNALDLRTAARTLANKDG